MRKDNKQTLARLGIRPETFLTSVSRAINTTNDAIKLNLVKVDASTKRQLILLSVQIDLNDYTIPYDLVKDACLFIKRYNKVGHSDWLLAYFLGETNQIPPA